MYTPIQPIEGYEGLSNRWKRVSCKSCDMDCVTADIAATVGFELSLTPVVRGCCLIWRCFWHFGTSFLFRLRWPLLSQSTVHHLVVESYGMAYWIKGRININHSQSTSIQVNSLLRQVSQNTQVKQSWIPSANCYILNISTTKYLAVCASQHSTSEIRLWFAWHKWQDSEIDLDEKGEHCCTWSSRYIEWGVSIIDQIVHSAVLSRSRS